VQMAWNPSTAVPKRSRPTCAPARDLFVHAGAPGGNEMTEDQKPYDETHSPEPPAEPGDTGAEDGEGEQEADELEEEPAAQ